MKFVFLLFLFVSLSCSDELINQDYLDWKTKRKKALYSKDGYLNLAGLYHISNGEYSMGSDNTNDIKMPEDFPDKFATIYVSDSTILFEYNIKVIYKDSIAVNKVLINYYNKGEFFSWNSFIWYVHMDSGVKAIRLRNIKHPLLQNDIKIDFFPYNENLVIKGIFEAYKQEKEIKFFNIQGGTFIDQIPGKIKFTLEEESYWLEPTISDSGKLFLVFGDLTNGEDTYGGGRFLYVLPPDLDGNVVLDFNKAYNPPCVFSSFTTCPIPSSQNVLPIKIKAGEKNYDGISFSSVYE